MYVSKEKVYSTHLIVIGIQDHEWILIKIAIATLVIGIPLAILNGSI